MAQATVSTKYQIVIPKSVREEVRLATGQVVQVIAKGGVISLVPDRPLEELRGFVSGIEMEGFRDETDRG